MSRSIRWRIAISFGLLILLVLLLFGFFLTRYISRIQMSSMENNVTSQAMVLADVLAAQWTQLIPEQMDASARLWADDINGRVTIVSADGTVTGESDENRAEMENHLNRPEIQQAQREGIGTSTRFSTTLAVRLLYVAAAIRTDGNLVGFVRLALPLKEVEKSIQTIQRQIWLALFGVTLLGVVLSFGAAHWIAKPLITISRLADQITEGKQVQFPYLNRKDEIGRLSQSLERMAHQLHERIDDLQNEQQKLSGLLSQMTDGVVIVDPDGNVSLLNPTAEQIFAATHENASGQSLVRALGYYQMHDLWEHSHNTGEGKIISLELTHQNRFIQVVATPLGGALQDFTLLLCQDMTHIRKLETVRRDFISNISHELRTPLASLKALAETLQISTVDDPETSRHFLERMDTEVDALTQMVNELLELARIEADAFRSNCGGWIPVNWLLLQQID